MTRYLVRAGLKLFALRSSTCHNPFERLVCAIGKPKQMHCFVKHERLVNVGLKVHRLLDSESVRCSELTVHAAGAIQIRQLPEPGITKKVEIPQGLTRVYD